MSTPSRLQSSQVQSAQDLTVVTTAIARLRAEHDAADDGKTRAILLHEIGVLEERGADTATAETRTEFVERRRWERVSLASTRAYALIGEGVEHTARVVDLGYGGVALETARAEEFGAAFYAVLHVPILPPVRVSLKPIWSQLTKQGGYRIGCAFIS